MVPSLLDDALQIWRAGVAGCQPATLVREHFWSDGQLLQAGAAEIALRPFRRVVVVGAGKCAAGVAAALVEQLQPAMATQRRLAGLVLVPAGGEADVPGVEVRAVRNAGDNAPTEAAAAGVQELLRLVSQLGPHDLCLAAITGGASALLPAPRPPLSLADKRTLTLELAARGADIRQLNLVRRELSTIKGGGLARACRAGRLVAAILSDVPGDDLATIGSGPTVEAPAAPAAARAVLAQFGMEDLDSGRQAMAVLAQRSASGAKELASVPLCPTTNVLVGNNAAAVDAAGMEAERLGYSHAMSAAAAPEGNAEAIGRAMAAQARLLRKTLGGSGPDCLILGGETTVALPPWERRGRGGRNQHLALATLAELDDWRGLAMVSGGTDGEDGPTDAAGAWVDAAVSARARELGLDPRDYLARCDAYRFFEQAGGLLKTGPTGTNVSDLRVLVARRRSSQERNDARN